VEIVNPLASDLDHILKHTSDFWDELEGKRLFITGGTGFFGCWLLESFIWATERLHLGTSAVVLIRNPEHFRKKAPHLANHPAVELYSGDVRSFSFPRKEFSHIIHAATEASARLNEDNPLLMLDTIVEGTRRTLEFAKYCGSHKFLFVSSGAVYGSQPHTLSHVPEDYPGAPDCCQVRSAYGEGKRAAELLCALYSKEFGIQVKIARCYAFVGPYLPLDIHYAVGNFIRDGLDGGPIRVTGDGTPWRSYLYAADLALWLWTILFRGESCRPYNVGSAEAIRIADLAREVAQAFYPPVGVQISQVPVPGRPEERYVPDVHRAEAELNLRSSFCLRESISRTLHWYQEKSKRYDGTDDQGI
jgi:nucleoside-diphosphate-sugar epimerase